MNRQLVVWISPRPDAPSRLGLSVSRRVGPAVKRNRVKRCLRAAWRRLLPQFAEPIDVMVVARPAGAPLSLAEAEQSLGHLLRRWRRSRRTQLSQGDRCGPADGPGPTRSPTP